MSTAQDLPVAYGEPAAPPALRLLPSAPLDFDEAVLHLRPRLHRYAVRRLGDTHEAEELVQEALLRAYTHREQLGTADDLAAWATVVTGRLVIDRLRVRGRYTSVADVPEGTRVGRDTADVVVARDEARLALDALDAMPARQAALLWAREVEGQSYEELCQRFGMTEPAVRSVLTRARKALRKEYASRGGTLPVGGLAVLAPWVAGLTWADKLRQVATRVTAPAAMGAAGVTILGGLVLSPFTALPQAPSGEEFAPSQAVVKTTASDVLHGFVVPLPGHAPAAPEPTAATPQRQSRAAVVQVGKLSTVCVNDSDTDDGGTSVVLPVGLPSNPGSGTERCDRAESNPGNTIRIDAPIASVPVVTTDRLDCQQLPAVPLISCSPEPSTQGVTQ